MLRSTGTEVPKGTSLLKISRPSAKIRHYGPPELRSRGGWRQQPEWLTISTPLDSGSAKSLDSSTLTDHSGAGR
jgi:hypothetical protein